MGDVFQNRSYFKLKIITLLKTTGTRLVPEDKKIFSKFDRLTHDFCAFFGRTSRLVKMEQEGGGG